MVAMNVFRLLGDTSHLLSFIVMFWKLFTSKSVAGISLKTQLLYVIVFCFRYLDIFWNFLSIYNTIMKVIFISSSVAVVYVMKFGVPHKDTYSQEDDAFPIAYLVAPAALMGVAFNQDHESPFEMCWAFSIYLEAVAILPQLFMLQKQGGAEPLHIAAGAVPPLLHPQLDLPLRDRAALHAAHRLDLGHCPDGALPRLLLHVHEVEARARHRRAHRDRLGLSCGR
ncbi:hypothetical protein EMIHUDRAFT_425400 [Emiliania huxleyi CCMP1516]|uniref:ER lumen protein-retaining receptor n=2 Tax=Emiliania huxleyi TaxID=2903 RepID=A0A0D3I9V6_EMIH1|nr:hypothetical protein EMIHUDRAFT_425400 [Emiliania huxleyi CCMP1516]EOD08041.1 hypothetical protein EMIHUDRAFT_425400 [Emiliania huxleyi CCMP1516]|eukprot:XP_005760470.1 hypothetical protein EMIHUDRAFT_425400 [Emiliania huxleyi CCMP1516]